MAKDLSLLDEIWWSRFVPAWNDLGEHANFSDMGPVIFEVVDRNASHVQCVIFDADGRIDLAATAPQAEAPRFSATIDAWRRFVDGEYSAMAGVLRGHIAYQGPVSFAIRHGNHFDRLASVARTM